MINARHSSRPVIGLLCAAVLVSAAFAQKLTVAGVEVTLAKFPNQIDQFCNKGEVEPMVQAELMGGKGGTRTYLPCAETPVPGAIRTYFVAVNIEDSKDHAEKRIALQIAGIKAQKGLKGRMYSKLGQIGKIAGPGGRQVTVFKSIFNIKRADGTEMSDGYLTMIDGNRTIIVHGHARDVTRYKNLPNLDAYLSLSAKTVFGSLKVIQPFKDIAA